MNDSAHTFSILLEKIGRQYSNALLDVEYIENMLKNEDIDNINNCILLLKKITIGVVDIKDKKYMSVKEWIDAHARVWQYEKTDVDHILTHEWTEWTKFTEVKFCTRDCWTSVGVTFKYDEQTQNFYLIRKFNESSCRKMKTDFDKRCNDGPYTKEEVMNIVDCLKN
jgi:hypothetical protein